MIEDMPCFIAASFAGYPGVSLTRLIYGGDMLGNVGDVIAVITARYPDREQVYPLGVTAIIDKQIRLPDGTRTAQLKCREVFEVGSVSRVARPPRASGTVQDRGAQADPVEPQRRQRILELCDRWVRRNSKPEESRSGEPSTIPALITHVLETARCPPLGLRYGYKLMSQSEVPADDLATFQRQMANRIELLGERDPQRQLDRLERVLTSEL